MKKANRSHIKKTLAKYNGRKRLNPWHCIVGNFRGEKFVVFVVEPLSTNILTGALKCKPSAGDMIIKKPEE